MMMNPFSYLALRYKNCSMHVKLFASYFLLIFIPIIALPEHKDHRKAIDGDHRALLTANGK